MYVCECVSARVHVRELCTYTHTYTNTHTLANNITHGF